MDSLHAVLPVRAGATPSEGGPELQPARGRGRDSEHGHWTVLPPGSPGVHHTLHSHRGMGPTPGFWGRGIAGRVETTLFASPYILSSVCIPSALPTPTATLRQGALNSITNQEVSTEPAGGLSPGAFSRRDQELEWGPQPGHKAPWQHNRVAWPPLSQSPTPGAHCSESPGGAASGPGYRSSGATQPLHRLP